MAQLPALIISQDPVAAALVGSAAEIAGLAPRFAPPGRDPRLLLGTFLPAAVLADCDHPIASGAAFIGPAMMTGARVAIFCSEADLVAANAGRVLAERHGVDFFELPRDAERLTRFLSDVAA